MKGDPKMKKYDEMTWSERDRDEFLAELKADKHVKNIQVYKTGEGWLIEWEETRR